MQEFPSTGQASGRERRGTARRLATFKLATRAAVEIAHGQSPGDQPPRAANVNRPGIVPRDSDAS